MEHRNMYSNLVHHNHSGSLEGPDRQHQASYAALHTSWFQLTGMPTANAVPSEQQQTVTVSMDDNLCQASSIRSAFCDVTEFGLGLSQHMLCYSHIR
jgi:hypothetical protein